MHEFDKVKYETVKFMRGRYCLDEVAGMYGHTPCVRFRQGKKTIVAIILHEDYYDFQIIFGKAEKEKFEAVKKQFPFEIQKIYDDSETTLNKGKCLTIRVSDLKTLDTVKKLIHIKKKPNRKPFSKESAVYGKCGHRCDLCVHYTGITEKFREMLITHLNNVYGESKWDMRCTGCDTSDCHCRRDGNELCEPIKCLHTNKLNTCFECVKYPCIHATVGYRQLEHRSISADDVTWAILPYVPNQYENPQ